ncbi:MAG: LysM peptidoglycan-binding domain-containing protein, partial [Bacteroidota bacterium]
MKNSGIASVLCALLLVLEPGLKAGFVNQGAKIYDAGKYPFVRRDLNGIDNGQQGLRDFYRRLEMLEKGDLRKINVVHIGDSHLQADWFSGAVRMALQKRFGSAGRGLVFPYRIAKTNSPEDITAYTNASWNTRRTVQSYGKLPIGISGITANTFDSNYALRVSLGANDHNIDYRFNKVTLFSDKGPRIYDMKVGVGGSAQSWKPRPTSQSSETGQKAAYHRVNRGETLSSISRKYGLSIRRLQELNRMRGTTIYAGQRLLVRHGSKGRTSTPIASPPPPPGKYEALVKLSSRSLDQFTSTVYLEEPVSSIVFKGSKNEAIQQKMTLYGMVLENHEQTGILYHMIGVNGAQFRHYNGARYFHEQLESLDPDLVIVSLG